MLYDVVRARYSAFIESTDRPVCVEIGEFLSEMALKIKEAVEEMEKIFSIYSRDTKCRGIYSGAINSSRVFPDFIVESADILE